MAACLDRDQAAAVAYPEADPDAGGATGGYGIDRFVTGQVVFADGGAEAAAVGERHWL
ncbi:hypothetical protein [Nocardia sp. NPDC002869]|uniref:hypothetical protein n=1 Tax=Nocardia sp. NPDC002869 TaxID=3161032 RepID=UPI00398CD4B9